MNIFGLIFLLIAHYFSGRGLLKLFRIGLTPVCELCISMMTGIALLSFVPCILQLLHIPVTEKSVVIAVVIFAGVFSVPILIKFRKPQFKMPRMPASYEWSYIGILALLVAASVWRCFFFPPTPRDLLTGPELIAEYTVREGTMINSVFSIDLSTTNNIFKSPYITGLQIIYKFLVMEFGQTWLSVLFVSFTVWLYTLTRNRLHPLLAGILMLFFMGISELYGYTYMALYDYSNMIFFFAGFYFLARYMDNKKINEFFFSTVLFGFATYIRTETLVLVVMTLPLLFAHLLRSQTKAKSVLLNSCIFILVPALFFYLCIYVFIKNFVPIPFDSAGQLNQHLGDVSVFFQRFVAFNDILLFSKESIMAYGYFIVLFIIVLIADVFWIRKFNRESRIALYGILVVYLGLPLLGYLFPVMDLVNTTKRGLFKMFPLMLLYLCNSGVMLRLSAYLKQAEHPVVN